MHYGLFFQMQLGAFNLRTSLNGLILLHYFNLAKSKSVNKSTFHRYLIVMGLTGS